MTHKQSNPRSSEQGAVLVEFVIVIFAIFILLSGVIVMGFGWQAKMSLQTATRGGAKTVTNLGATSLADYSTVQTVLSGLDGIAQNNVGRIVIYNANTSGTVPAACLTSATGISGVCNVYLPAQYNLPASSYGCGSASPDRYWCPTSRQTSQASSAGPDYAGVYVQAQPPNVATMFNISLSSVSSTSVMRMEPT